MSTKDKLKKCFKEGEKGERHKGLRKIELNDNKIINHLIKAEHNMKVITYLKNGVFQIGLHLQLFIHYIIVYLLYVLSLNMNLKIRVVLLL